MEAVIDSDKVSGVILCGGSGRRMGNRDKGLLTLATRPFIDYVIERLAPQVADLTINSPHHDDYRHYGLTIIGDTVAGRVGPLAGLLSALHHCNNEWVIAVPCDTPRLPDDLVTRMVATVKREGKRLCSVSDGERLHGVVLLAHRSLTASLEAYLASGERRVQRWIEANDPAIADFSDQPGAFINLNTPEELRRLEEELCR